jgi:hypothetical protein
MWMLPKIAGPPAVGEAGKRCTRLDLANRKTPPLRKSLTDSANLSLFLHISLHVFIAKFAPSGTFSPVEVVAF